MVGYESTGSDSCLLTKQSGHRFYSSGREDADVLMLGRGRPYYLELLNPRRVEATAAEMKELQDAINEAADGQVQARDLQIVSKCVRFAPDCTE